MYSYFDLKEFFRKQDFRLIMVADAETRVHEKKGDTITVKIPAGGVSVALDPIMKASGGLYIGRGKTEADKEVVNKENKIVVKDYDGEYTLKRVFCPKEEEDAYYYGFANQTLWPLCHVAFEAPAFHQRWFEGYKKVNERFTKSIKEELRGNKKTVLWINDYQLTLVPGMMKGVKNTIIAMFWHIPWPTWEVFRILPQKKDILESLLCTDFIAFHRGYQANNFLECVERELEVRIDRERGQIHYKEHVTTVANLPLGIDTDVIRSLLIDEKEQGIVGRMVKHIFGTPKKEEEDPFKEFFDNHKVIVGVDRLDYTKGLILRLHALDRFFEKNPSYRGKVVYVGIVAPSREPIPSYRALKKTLKETALEINKKYMRDNGWVPIFLLHNVFNRSNLMQFYQKADLCLITPRDDGMNLVSKEFVVAASKSKNPGMLVLSQFAGSAIDLVDALIVNPYDVNEVASAIKRGLEMDTKEKIRRITRMTETLDERNIYIWAESFVKGALATELKSGR